MSSIDKAVATQLANIEKRTGRSLDELYTIIRNSGLIKHGELRDMLKREHAMGHGDANTLVHTYFNAQQAVDAAAPADDPLDTIYSGAKSLLRPIHDRLMEKVGAFGEFEIAPRKNYVSLRCRKQFATIGPATQKRVEVGLNMKGIEPTERLEALAPGGMCQYRINVTEIDQVDDELLGWIRMAYEAAA